MDTSRTPTLLTTSTSIIQLLQAIAYPSLSSTSIYLLLVVRPKIGTFKEQFLLTRYTRQALAHLIWMVLRPILNTRRQVLKLLKMKFSEKMGIYLTKFKLWYLPSKNHNYYWIHSSSILNLTLHGIYPATPTFLLRLFNNNLSSLFKLKIGILVSMLHLIFSSLWMLLL